MVTPEPSTTTTTRNNDQPDSCIAAQASTSGSNVHYRQYQDEEDLPLIMRLIDNELSEPYSIFTYRYFLHNWPNLCWIAYDGDQPFGTVVCKMERHREKLMRGYVAMLVVDKTFRGKGAGRELVRRSIQEMIAGGCEEVALEAEVCNQGALRLYQSLGFIRDKRLHRYYLNGVDAFRLKLRLPAADEREDREWMEAMAAEDAERAAAAAAESEEADGAAVEAVTA